MYEQTETVDAQTEPRKVRLDDEQVKTLADALVLAGVAMRNAAAVAEALEDPFIARQCVERAERFETLLALGEGVTRVTVRF
jgi:hypothetical protein